MVKRADSLVDYVRDDVLARKIQKLARAELRGVDIRWVDQSISPLGPRIHINAVKRRFAEAEAQGREPVELGAAMRGKRTYLLTQESIAEELGNRPKPIKAKAADNDTDEAEAYAASFAAAVRKGAAK